MPFQDIEDAEAAPAPRTPTAAERLFRKLFLEDWGLKLIALAITIVLWLAVTGQNKPVTLRVTGVQLNFLRPDGLEVSNDPPATIDVVFTGSKDKLDRIEPRELIANVDLSDQKAGERVVRLTLDRVKMDLQEDVKIQGFHPAAIPIRLEPVVETALEVEVRFAGRLADGYEVGNISVSPAKVRLRGPADRIGALRKVVTETVSLDGRKESFNVSHIEVNIPDPKIDIIDPPVDIHVDVVEKKPGDVNLRFAGTDESPLLASLNTVHHPSF
ncbi:MAG TPA: CdaR family protein [Pyrinomonadaceae bacterium]|nr:CdaR family protein [Pyrinomonadaceae bacterium]